MKPKPDKKQILSSIAAVAKELGRAPSKTEFYSHAGISEYFVLQFFRTWSEAVRAAGLQPYLANARVENRVLLEDWGKVVRRNRGVPPRHIYRREGKFNPGTLQKRFRGYSSVPQAFRTFAKGRREWADVVALLPAAEPTKMRGRSKEDAAFRMPLNVARQAPLASCGNNWRDHRGRAKARPYSALPGHTSSKACNNKTLKGRAMCGNPIDFRGLRHEPVNEQGVVLLFGMLAKDLGFMIEAVQKEFPDCKAKRQIAPDRWQRVLIEFEFESKNFRDHGHPLNGCDLIVCWRHNWHDCPEHIEVLELSSTIKSLAATFVGDRGVC